MLKRCIEELAPPIVLRCARPLLRRLRVLGAGRKTRPFGAGETPEEVNECYRTEDVYRIHYTDSSYYFLWCVVADRLMRRPELPILEVGCGAGQFASLLRDKGIEGYFGFDYSAEAIAIAKASCPTYMFFVKNVCEPNLLETLRYKTVVTLEVLEHIREDVEVLKRLRPGTRVLASVPSFPYYAHFRHFSGCEEVARRYAELFEEFHVDSFDCPGNTKRFFLFEGIRRQGS
jgi:SAM-dependent methyltransferase